MTVEQYDENPPQQLSGVRAAMGPGVLLILILAVTFAVVGHDGKSQRYQEQSNVSVPPGSALLAKPSPIIPFGAKRQSVATPAVERASADSAIASAVAGSGVTTVEAASTGIPAAMPRPRETEGAFAAKHQKSFGRGCAGKLELTARSLDFTCDSGTDGALHVAVDEIKGANSNGIELKTGEKYHFDLQMGKGEEQAIFRNWVSTHSGDRPGRGAGGL